jgi:hypothetical protein
MHPRMTELFDYLDEQHEQLKATFEAIPPAQRSVRPSPERWSATDVLGHLTLLERRLAGLFAAKIEAARGAGLPAESDDSPLLPTMPLARVLDRETKIVAPEAVQPGNLPAPATWNDYEQARAQLKAAALTGDGLALAQVTHAHPAFGSLDLYTWLAFAGGHAARHAAQIRETAATLPVS